MDETTDLFDSWSFHLPFDQSGRCERLSWDADTGTVTFLCTVQTMDGSPIPIGSKMTFSVRQLLTGKETLENAVVDLDLADFAQETESAGPEQSESRYFQTGGSGDVELAETVPMLLPGPALAEPPRVCRSPPPDTPEGGSTSSCAGATPPGWTTTVSSGWRRMMAPGWSLCAALPLQLRIRQSDQITTNSSLTSRRRNWQITPSAAASAPPPPSPRGSGR